MSTVLLCVHHHGELIDTSPVSYLGGIMEEIVDFDTDLFSFRDLDEFALKFNYGSSALVYYCVDGHSFNDGVKIIFDDESVRAAVELCKPFGRMDLYVDHAFDFPEEPNTPKQNTKGKDYEDECQNSDSDDAEYEFEDESEDSESELEPLVPDEESDNELKGMMQDKKKFLEDLDAQMKQPVTDAYDSDESNTYMSLSTSSEDENARIGYVGPPKIKKPKIRNRIDDTTKFEVGQRYGSMSEFREAVKAYAVRERRQLQFPVSDKRRCQVMCQPKCPFYIWCSMDKSGDFCQIKTLVETHVCTKPYNNKLASVKYLCGVFGDRIRNNPQWKCRDLAETIKSELEIQVPKIKISRLRKAALEGVAESLKEHYSRVRDFGKEVLLSNAKNTVKISTSRNNPNDPPHFKRLYICYHALKVGWKTGCRPVIGLDGCFLKTVCGGQLLSAVGRDGNNCMFPICWAVVESENTDSWKWFIEQMAEDLDIYNGTNLTIISDQQKGLINAVQEFLPEAEHRFCTRHLCSNFTGRFKNRQLKNVFWQIAVATYKVAYIRGMKLMERLNKSAHTQLASVDPKSWCKSHFSTHSKCDSTCNNMSESFNSWIIQERYQPLLHMMQGIHHKIMIRLREKRAELSRLQSHLVPKAQRILNKRVTDARNWEAQWDGTRKFQVRNNSRSLTVDLDEQTCDCRVFDLSGIPCEHACAAIISRRQNPEDFVSHYFTRSMCLEAYKQSLEAMPGEDFWDYHGGEVMLPPQIPKKLRGRPKNLRRREHWEGGNRTQTVMDGVVVQKFNNRRVTHCSLCKLEGHRKTTCPTKSTKGDKAETTKEDETEKRAEAGSNEEQGKQEQRLTGRQKLPFRRPRAKGISIREPEPHKSHVPQEASEGSKFKDKGKGKIMEEPVLEEDSEGEQDEEPKQLLIQAADGTGEPFVTDSLVLQDLISAGYEYKILKILPTPPMEMPAPVMDKEKSAPVMEKTKPAPVRKRKPRELPKNKWGGKRRSIRIGLIALKRFANTEDDPVKLD